MGIGKRYGFLEEMYTENYFAETAVRHQLEFGFIKENPNAEEITKRLQKINPRYGRLVGHWQGVQLFSEKTHAKNYPTQTTFENHTKARGLAKIND